MKAVLPLALCLAAAPAGAEMPLELPLGAVETARHAEAPARHDMPVGRYTPEDRPALALEGRVLTRAWRLPPERADTGSVARILRDQAVGAGYEILFDCADRGCGGFDFRFGSDILPPPEMEVDLADFRYFAARGPGAAPAHLSALVSRTPRGGFVQVTEILPADAPDIPLAPPPAAASGASGDIAAALAAQGRAVLDGVVFAPGQTAVGAAPVPALDDLAEFLRGTPGTRLVIVGHTDSTGSLESNLALSRARAASVRDRLIGLHGIAPDRLAAAGAGYLAPRASNATEDGRAANRRVEAVLLPSAN